MGRGSGKGGLLGFLYGTAPGRLLLRPLTSRGVSRMAGRLMDSRVSKPLIAPFIRKNGIEMGEYLPEDYPSFNAFFTRRIRPEARPIDPDPAHLIAPCDGRLSVYAIGEDSVFTAPSGDIGNASYEAPSFYGVFSTAPESGGADIHDAAYLPVTDSAKAGELLLLAGKTISATAADILTDESFRAAVREAWEKIS